MIKFNSVSKHFPPDTYALKDVSFEIDPGELVLLTGPSGSGKTTIMRLITKEYTPTEGNIIFSDQDLNEIKNSKLHEHKRRIGVVFQDYKLLSELNIWENIALPLSIIGKKEEEIEQRVTDLLTLVALTDKAFLFPKQLSGGEAQRISIARALSTGPGIIFADEPTGNLDKITSLQIGKLIQKINSLGTTIILATHDHDVIDLFNNFRHIKIENGKIIADSKKTKQAENKKLNQNTKESKSNENETETQNKTEIKNQTETEKSKEEETKNKKADNSQADSKNKKKKLKKK